MDDQGDCMIKKNLLGPFSHNIEEFYFDTDTMKWYDENLIVAPKATQNELNSKYGDSIHPPIISDDDREKRAKSNMDLGSFSAALKDLLYLRKKRIRLAHILPMISRCYRQLYEPEKAIALYEEYRYNEKMITFPLLTSVAAAYMDVKQYDQAKKCCDKAFAITDGTSSCELQNTYDRLEKEAPWIFIGKKTKSQTID